MWKNIRIFAPKFITYMPMKYSIISQCLHYQRCLCNPSESGLRSEMKESKASERKNTQMSLIFHLIFLCSVLLFYSCNNHEKYDFESSDEALNTIIFIRLSDHRKRAMPSNLPHLSICGMNAQTQSTNLFRKTLRLRLMPV